MITDNSPVLGTFSVRDKDSDPLEAGRLQRGAVLFSVSNSVATVEADEITPLIQFLAHGLTTEQKTQLAMSLLDSVSFKDVLDHFGLESQR